MTNEQISVEDLKAKIQYGDYVTLAKMLKTNSTAAAQQRFNREQPEAIKAMTLIIKSREELIENFQNSSTEHDQPN